MKYPLSWKRLILGLLALRNAYNWYNSCQRFWVPFGAILCTLQNFRCKDFKRFLTVTMSNKLYRPYVVTRTEYMYILLVFVLAICQIRKYIYGTFKISHLSCICLPLARKLCILVSSRKKFKAEAGRPREDVKLIGPLVNKCNTIEVPNNQTKSNWDRVYVLKAVKLPP